MWAQGNILPSIYIVIISLFSILLLRALCALFCFQLTCTYILHVDCEPSYITQPPFTYSVPFCLLYLWKILCIYVNPRKYTQEKAYKIYLCENVLIHLIWLSPIASNVSPAIFQILTSVASYIEAYLSLNSVLCR